MLSFENNVHILSGQNRRILPHIQPKEGIFRQLRVRGSLAVEAALVLPIFIFAMVSIIALLIQLRFGIHVQNLLYEESVYLGEVTYDTKFNEGAVAADLLERLAEDSAQIPVQGGEAGVVISAAGSQSDEILRLTAAYDGKLPYDLHHLFQKSFRQGVIIHSWVGYINGLNSSGVREQSEVYVYITENGEVYHRSRECTHIRLTIKQITGADIDGIRNDEGKKYKSCSHCHGKKNSPVLYITPEGDKYHADLNCSGLSRSVRQIPLSQVGGRRPCSRCGY